jgi:hypothetical protein
MAHVVLHGQPVDLKAYNETVNWYDYDLW